MTLPSGDGIAWVENARGLLIHRVRLTRRTSRHYGIVAPTEWNFHPRARWRRPLRGPAAADRANVEQRATATGTFARPLCGVPSRVRRMHEMSLAESVREIVDETARANGARRVAAVRLEIGRLAQVEIEAMRFAFEVVMRGSLADTARLEIVETDGTAWCMRCSRAGGDHAARRRLPRHATATSCRSPAATACG